MLQQGKIKLGLQNNSSKSQETSIAGYFKFISQILCNKLFILREICL